jgi:hypothetical protein
MFAFVNIYFDDGQTFLSTFDLDYFFMTWMNDLVNEGEINRF